MEKLLEISPKVVDDRRDHLVRWVYDELHRRTVRLRGTQSLLDKLIDGLYNRLTQSNL